MIDPPVLSVSGPAARQQPSEPPPAAGADPARLPVPARLGRLIVLAVVFVCAACGLVYELELVALASYLAGDTVTQASVVLSVMVFAMGIGSLFAKRLRCHAALGFGLVEAGLALVGGSSAMALYALFAWFGQTHTALVVFSLVIGVLIGAEVPLLMTLIQRIRRQDAGGAVADLFAADYVGALVGGLGFSFLLLPVLGQLSGALLTGAVNTVAGGGMVLWLFHQELGARERWLLVAANVSVLVLLATGAVFADSFERAARRAVYGAEVRVAVRTDVQEVVLTGGSGALDGGDRFQQGGGDASGAVSRSDPRPLSLFLDGRLRVSSRDEFRYHEALVHPAMDGPRGRVLVLGGGNGLAVRELLRYPDVESVTVVELDPGVLRLARSDPGLANLNQHAFGDARVRVVQADAFDWLRRSAGQRPYQVVISDLPDPGISSSTKLYSQEFYGLVKRVLATDGRLLVHAGTPSLRPRSFWTVDGTLRSVGLRTLAYRVGGRLPAPNGGPGRSSGDDGRPRDWGFVLAARGPVRLGPPPDAPALRSLTRDSVRSAERSTARDRPNGLPPSTLMRPRYLG